MPGCADKALAIQIFKQEALITKKRDSFAYRAQKDLKALAAFIKSKKNRHLIVSAFNSLTNKLELPKQKKDNNIIEEECQS